MQTIDFHLHTLASDGSDTPLELLNKSISAGLSAIAITDHDTLDGYNQIAPLLDNYAIRVIPGIEFSTRHMGLEIHIIGLFPNPSHVIQPDAFLFLKESRTNRNFRMLEQLNRLGFQLTMDDIQTVSGDQIITRAHFAQAMVAKGYCCDYKDAFTRYLSENTPGYVPREKITPQIAIDVIHENKGLAILAHPLLYKLTQRDLINWVATFKAMGLDGIEAYYSTHSKSDERFIIQLAHSQNLLLSGGSDYHGKLKPNIQIGRGLQHLAVPIACLEAMDQLHAIKYPQ